MRVYKDDFISPTTNITILNKVLYDEREWRSVKLFGVLDYQNNLEEIKAAITNKFMSQRFNLTFDRNDIVAILVSNDSQKIHLLNFIKNSETFLDNKMDLNKIMLFTDFKEN